MSVKKELIQFCHRVYEKNFVSAYDGNLSVRLSADRFLITRSGICKGDVEESDILEIDGSGRKISGEGKVTTEYKIHLFVYNKRPEINSVVHCHPVFATAFATKGEGLEKPVFPEVILNLGKVPLCKYGTPSTEEIPESMLPYINRCNAMLFQNHGAVTFGTTVKDAYYKMEKLEHAAKTLFIARQLGGERPLPGNKVDYLYSIAESVYGISTGKKQ